MRWGSTPGKLEGAGTPFNWPAAIGYGRQPYASLVSGPGALAAGPDGVQMGIFGWADPITGEVTNVQSDGALLGFVLPVIGLWNWQRSMPTPPGAPVRGLILRPGMQCIVCVSGDFKTVFPFGGQAGSRVFVDPATGVPYSRNPGGYVATPWTLMETGCSCNAHLRISTFSKPLN